jgi:acyl-CoA thioester hydrolase
MKNSPSSENSPNKSHSGPLLPPFIQVEQRVRYSETDRMGVAHNKSYFEWFEIGRTEYCRQKGVSYRDIEERGFYLVVAESFCRYKKPLRYDDRFFIRTGLKEISPKKTVFAYELWTMDGLTLVAEGYTVHISVNKNGTITPMPEDILDKIRST